MIGGCKHGLNRIGGFNMANGLVRYDFAMRLVIKGVSTWFQHQGVWWGSALGLSPRGLKLVVKNVFFMKISKFF